MKLTASVELTAPFKIEDKASGYFINPGQAGIALTGDVINVVNVSASSSEPNNPATKIVDGSGLLDWDKDGLEEHGTKTSDMWLSAKGKVNGWLIFDFNQPRKLDGFDIWNYNEPDGTRRGIQKADISVWTSETGWRTVQKACEFERASAGEEFDDATFIDMGRVMAAKVKFDKIKNFDDVNYVGLSEVRFYEPAVTQASRPVPANGGTSSDKKTLLAWMPGEKAKSHKVYFGTDSSNLELIGEKAGSGFMRAEVSGVAQNTKYFWRVDEIGENGNFATGKIWSFTKVADEGNQARPATEKITIKFKEPLEPAKREK